METENLTPESKEEAFDRFLEETEGEYLSRGSASLEQIDCEIQLHRQALKDFSSPPSDPCQIAVILFSLGALLSHRFELQSTREDIDEAINCFNQVLELPITRRMRGKCLFFLSLAFRTRFHVVGMRTNRREDLDMAVQLSELAMTEHVSEDISDAAYMNLMGLVKMSLYSATGETKHLDAAIEAFLLFMKDSEQEGCYTNVSGALVNISDCLRERYERSGRIKDLVHAVELSQRAVDVVPQADRRRLRCLVNLANQEMYLSTVTQDMECGSRALRHLQEAKSSGTEYCKEDNEFNCFLSTSYGVQSSRMGKWDEAIETMREVTKDFAYMRGVRGSHIILCRSLLKKWQETRGKELLDEAIVTARLSLLDEAIVTARWLIEVQDSQGDELIVAYDFLGTCLIYQYHSTGDHKYLEKALSALLKGFQITPNTPLHRIRVGHKAISILCWLERWERAHKLSLRVVDLLVIASGRSLDCTDKQYWLQNFSGQVSDYVSIALLAESDVFDIINMLETCRGSILGHMIDSRTDLDSLKDVAPDKAERFAALLDEINSEIRSSEDVEIRVQDISRRDAAEEEIRDCLEDIRKLEGFHQFLLGPTRSELKAVAAQGPIIIINIAIDRSDAIIVTTLDHSPLILLPLPELEYEEVIEYQVADLVHFSGFADWPKKNKKYLRLLEWLWDKCVQLIFQKLDDLAPTKEKLHVWWLGMGIASSLPFHAAGIYTGKVRESALSRAISSYTPSLKILMHGRRKLKNDTPESEVQRLPSKPEMLIVSMPSTPGMSDLPGVQAEVEEVLEIVREAYSIVHELQPSAKATRERLEKCQVVHFACHGESNLTDPLRSHLVLQATNADSAEPIIDTLNVEDVSALNLSHAKLAFLSACSTAENNHDKLRDEALHLAAGFQVAGYLHTVGNLWPADDEVSVHIVKGFYQHLLEAGEFGSGQNVAKALNEALTDAMEKWWKIPLTWAQFVHFGI